MSWATIKADAQDAIRGGMGVHQAVKKFHSGGAVAVFYCGLCTVKTTLALKHLFDDIRQDTRRPSQEDTVSPDVRGISHTAASSDRLRVIGIATGPARRRSACRPTCHTPFCPVSIVMAKQWWWAGGNRIVKTPAWLTALGIVLLCVAVSLATTLFAVRTRTAGQAGTDVVYDRVIESGKIRCAYVVYPPSCIKDPNTGKLSGIMVDVIREMGKRLGLEIEFTEEAAWGSMIEGLQTDRYDLVVSGIWPNASRSKLVDFSTPLYYSPIGIYVAQRRRSFLQGPQGDQFREDQNCHH